MQWAVRAAAGASPSEEVLRSFVDEAPVALALFDRQMRYLAVSRRWLADLRVTDPDVVGRSHYEVFPEVPERWKAIHRRCLAGAIERADEDRFDRADGSTDWLKWEVRPWRDGSGEIGGIIIYVEDVTSRVVAERELARAEAAARDTHARVRSILDGIEVFVALVSRAGLVVDVNEAPLRATGLTRAEVVGRGLLDAVGPFVTERALDRLRAALEGAAAGTRARFDVQAQIGGSAFAYQVSFCPVRDAQESVRGVLLSAIDVTVRNEAIEQARAGEERFRRVVESMDDLVFTLDRAHRHVEVLGGWVAREGLSREHFVGRTAAELLGPAGEAHRAPTDRALAGETVVYEWSMGDGPGARHFQTSLSPLHDEAGGVTGVVGVGREITERRRAEEQLLRTERLASMGTLAAGVAHEVNNALAPLLLSLERARALLGEGTRGGGAGGDELASLVADASEGAARIERIVGDLKTFSRADAHRAAPTDVAEVLETALRIAAHTTRRRARVVRDFARVSPVHGDAGRLAQVFVNLLVNAAEALPEGEAARHEIRVTVRPCRTGAIVVEIRDDGPGIPAPIRARLFEPFFTTKETGTGLGLPISHQIVAAHDGRLEVDDAPGGGAIFRVTLPSAAPDGAERSPRGRSWRPA